MENGFYNQMRRPAVFNKIDKLVELGALSEKGRDWLMQYVDCVHWQMSGNSSIAAPNRTNSKALVSTSKSVYNITQPAGIAGKWDMHIQVEPELNLWQAAKFSAAQNFYSTKLANSEVIGAGVTVQAVAAGGNCAWELSAPLNANQRIVSWAPTADQTKMQGRLVAMCLKYEDVTPKLTQGGTIHAYRIPDEDKNDTTVMSFAATLPATAWSAFGAELRRRRPLTVADCSPLPSYMNHACKEGCFMPIMVDPEFQQQMPDFTFPVYTTIDWAIPFIGQVVGPEFTTGTPVGVPANYSAPTHSITHSGAKPCGIWLTGLDATHSGTFTITYVYENFPNPRLTEKNYVPLMVHGTDWDPVAVSIAQHIMSRCPTMGFARDNDNWTWLAKAFSSISDELSAMIALVPHPVAKAAAVATSFAGSAAKKYAKGQKKEAKRAKQKGAPVGAANHVPKSKEQLMAKMAKKERQKEKKRLAQDFRRIHALDLAKP
jgi:hypothetical protein